MQNQLKPYLTPLCLVMFFVIALTACGTVQHVARIDRDEIPLSQTRVQVGSVTNDTGKVFDVNPESMLTDALNNALEEKDMLAKNADAQYLILNAQIIEYEKGDAFQRWIMPGLGPTVLEVHCDILWDDQVVGVADALRTVDAGGGYTIGAWKTIYRDVARDVVDDVSAQLGQK